MKNRCTRRILNSIYLSTIMIFLYFPLIIVCFNSFNSGKSSITWSGFTIDWYLKLFSNESIMKALGLSLLLAFTVTVISVIIGTIGSIALYMFKNEFSTLIAPIIHLPIFTPEIIIGVAFMQIFSILGIKFGLMTLLLSHLSFCVPFVIITISARLRSVGNNLEDAARDLGATVWQSFFHITIPELMPGILSGAALSFIMSFDDVIISFFMSGATNTTLPVKVYSMLRVGVSPEINALTTITVVLTIICVCIFYSNKSTKNI